MGGFYVIRNRLPNLPNVNPLACACIRVGLLPSDYDEQVAMRRYNFKGCVFDLVADNIGLEVDPNEYATKSDRRSGRPTRPRRSRKGIARAPGGKGSA